MEQRKYKERTCNKCGWVHFAMTRAEAEAEVETFNNYFHTLSEEEQESFGGKCSNIKQYEHCFFCGNDYTDFRDAREDDCPVGTTLGPIIEE